MARVKRGFKARRRRNKTLKQTEGFWGRRKSVYTVAREALDRAFVYAFRDRRRRKRDFRRLWITRINAALTSHGIVYSRFIASLSASNVLLNRKSLAEIAVRDPEGFATIVETVKK